MPATAHPIDRLRQRLFSKKVGTFFICLLVASLLWLVHALNRNYKYTLSIPVRFVNLPANKVIIGELPDKLQFDIKTSGLKLAFIILKHTYNELQIDFNALKSNAKSQAYSLSTGNFNLNSAINFDVEVLKVRPDTLFFTLNKGAVKIVPVKVMKQVSCAPGYQLIYKPTVTPSYITISGDSAVLRSIDTIPTQTIAESNLQANYSKRVSLKKVNASVLYSTGDVMVDLVVDRMTEGIVQVPLKLINEPEHAHVRLLPPGITIKYLVAMKDYESINESSFKAVVDYNDILAKKETLPVELLRSPSEANIRQISPMHVKYLIYK